MGDVVPFNESPNSQRLNSASLGYHTKKYDHLRDGINISLYHIHSAKQSSPRLNSTPNGHIGSFAKAIGIVSHASGGWYVDRTVPSASHYVEIGTASLSPEPLDVGTHEPEQRSGIIEPITIRDQITFRTLFDVDSMSVSAQLCDASLTHDGHASQLTFVHDASSTYVPFIDVAAYVGSVSLPQEPVSQRRLLRPYDEKHHDARIRALVSGSDMINRYVSMSFGISGTHPYEPEPKDLVRLSAGGHDFWSAARYGYDSYSFADMHAFAPRGHIQQRDSRSGSFPTIARTGDRARAGNHAIVFDDTNVITFVTSTNIDVGRNLHSGSSQHLALRLSAMTGPRLQYPIIGQRQTVSHTSGVIVTTGIVRAGIADVGYIPSFGITSSIVFNESAIDLRQTSFYATGTITSSLGTSFSSPLRSKTQLVIDISPRQRTDVYFSTGSGASPVRSGIAYFNNITKVWEPHGDITTGSNVDYFNYEFSVRPKSLLAFFPNPGVSTASLATAQKTFLQLMHDNVGYVTSDCGFPYAAKFDATSSQLIRMSDYINQPFLLEKLTIELSGAFGGMTLVDRGPAVFQVFILNQYDVGHPNTSVQILSGSSTAVATSHASYAVTRMKDIVTVCYVSLRDSDGPSSHYRDLTISSVANAAYTGSFFIEKTVSSPTKHGSDIASLVGVENVYGRYETRHPATGAGDDASVYVRNVIGSRNALFNNSPRSYINAVSSDAVSASYADPVYVGTGIAPTVTNPFSSSHELVSPYLLLPSDRLVIGVANQFGIGNRDDSAHTEDIVAKSFLSMFEGRSRITMYGSLVRDEKEFNDTLNQHLVSDAIHELVCSQNDMLDQFDLNYRQLHSGSMLDNVMSGSFTLFNQHARRIIGSSISSSLCTSGAFQFSVNAIDESNVPYASFPPSPGDIHITNGKKLVALNSTAMIFIGLAGSAITTIDDEWVYRYPFESRYSTLTRSLSPGLQKTPYDAYSLLDPSTFVGTFQLAYIGKYVTINATATAPILSLDAGSSTRPMALDAFRGYFGIGDHPSHSMVEYKDDSVTLTYGGHVVDLRGFKYGIFNVPKGLHASFRRTRYGQLRDMLEQRLDTKLYDTVTDAVIESPVRIISSSLVTQSSNKSFEATSSLPFFDGIARN